MLKERLGQHVQHLLKFGRDVFDPLQYSAVVADINMPLLINAGKEIITPALSPVPSPRPLFPPRLSYLLMPKGSQINHPTRYAYLGSHYQHNVLSLFLWPIALCNILSTNAEVVVVGLHLARVFVIAHLDTVQHLNTRLEWFVLDIQTVWLCNAVWQGIVCHWTVVFAAARGKHLITLFDLCEFK